MNNSPKVAVAICCYNAARYLPNLLKKLVKQACPIDWEILIIDNNSTDNSSAIIDDFSETSPVLIKYVLETQQGIAYARNRAIEESKINNCTYLAFIDADELPSNDWLSFAITSLQSHNADCVGGAISLALPDRPPWLTDNLMPFLGKVDHADQQFQIQDNSTPIWSGNIIYQLRLFNNGLRFDTRYNREGKGVGGGEDGILFNELLKNKCHLWYEPKMEITHLIPPEKLIRSYFLKLHFNSGKKSGLYELEINTSDKLIFHIPRYMFLLLGKKIFSVLTLLAIHSPYMREAMNVSFLLGQIIGLSQQYKTK